MENNTLETNSQLTPMVDGMRSDSGANSPTSSSGGQSRPRPKQVPISRSATSGYERPERARTSHACEPCRERKTKCDGERPSCRRCLHTGTGCHYGYGKGWKKRKTAEDLTVTSRKLARYEELLNEIFPLVSTDVRGMIDAARQQEFAPAGTVGQMDTSTPSSSSAFDTDTKATSPSLGRLPLPLPAAFSSHSAPPFGNTPRSLPPPPSLDPSISPRQPNSSNSKSPTDESSSSIRLPSITRQGILVEGAPRAIQGQSPFTPAADLPGTGDHTGLGEPEKPQGNMT